MSFSCPSCKRARASGSRFCPDCGCCLEEGWTAYSVCPRCKTTYAADTKFCVKDGVRLIQAEDSAPKCVLCGRVYGAGVAFCPADGGAVRVLPLQSALEHKITRMYAKVTTSTYPKASISLRLTAWILDILVAGALCIPAVLFFIIALGNFWTKFGRYDVQERYSYRNFYELFYELYGYGDVGRLFFLFLGFGFLLLPVLYSLFKDGLGAGQSLGKKAMGLMTLELKTHRPCRWGYSFIRNITGFVLYYLSFWLWFLIEPILVLVLSDGRKISDRISGVQVVEKRHFLSAFQKTNFPIVAAEDTEKDTAENL